MTTYRFEFSRRVSTSSVESSLIVAVWCCESLHGESQVLMDGRYDWRKHERLLFIDASTDVGKDLNKLFLGLILREFDDQMFAVCPVEPASDVAEAAS